MANYQAYFFGAPRLEYQDQSISIDTRKALALLAYLLLKGEPQNRDTLAALLWPESAQKSARAALRRTLSTLRSALDEELLDFGREIIAIHAGDDLWCDVLTFQEHLEDCQAHGHPANQVCDRCLHPLQLAAELYKGDFMAGFSLRDSATFDDWQFFEADRLRRELGNVLERLVALYAHQGDFEAALDAARRWSTLDLLNEAAHRTLILLYFHSGQRNAALRQYRECLRILDQELGVPPLEETTHLYEAVKENRFTDLELARYLPGPVGEPREDRIQPPPEPIQPASPGDYPLTGRETQWEQLSRLYGQIKQDGVFVAITGEIGTGKSRLAQEFISDLVSHGSVALSARCYAGESNLAYTPLIDLLRQGLHQAGNKSWWQGLNPHWLSEISLLVPEISEIIPDLPPPGPASDPGAQNRFYEAVCQVLTALVRGSSPGIIYIDNLEWVDESTLGLLAYYARRLVGRPFLLLASWSLGSSAATAVLDQVLNEAVQQGYGAHLPLPPLQPEQALKLISSAPQVGQQHSPAFIDHLVKVSGGLPLMLVEYLLAARKGEIDSRLAAEDWPIPTGLHGLLQSRLAGLSGSAHQLLQAAAVIGQTFTSELLQSTSGRSEEEIIQGLEELLAHYLVKEIHDPGDTLPSPVSYDFRHEQVRSLMLEDLSLVRRRLLHRRTAAALETQQKIKRGTSLSGQIAYHYQQAGESEAAAEYYFQAGQHDREMHANPDALSHYQSALALGYPRKPEVLSELGDLYTLQGDYPQAIQQFEAAAAYEVPEMLPGIEQKIGQVYLRLGQWEQAACHFEAAQFNLSLLPKEIRKAFEARLLADTSLVYHHRGQTDQAEIFAQQALDLAEGAADPAAMAQAQNLLGILARSNQQYQEAVGHLERSLAYARELDYPQGQVAALNNLALAQADLGDLPAALETISQAIAETLVLGDRHLEAALRSNYADILRAGGETGEALEQLKQAAAIFAAIGQKADDWQPEIWKLVEW